jgi:hypothetical protein
MENNYTTSNLLSKDDAYEITTKRTNIKKLERKTCLRTFLSPVPTGASRFAISHRGSSNRVFITSSSRNGNLACIIKNYFSVLVPWSFEFPLLVPKHTNLSIGPPGAAKWHRYKKVKGSTKKNPVNVDV